jgi:hypothetical protein
MAVAAEPFAPSPAGDDEHTPAPPVEAPASGRARLEEVLGRDLAGRLISALSGPHGRCDLQPW